MISSARKADLPGGVSDNKRKKTPRGPVDVRNTFQKRTASFTPTSSENETPNRKRKGARRKEQAKKDESNFTEMVNNYKDKLFGRDEGEVSVKRSRWFDD